MSAIDADSKREDVLLAFSVEPSHDKATLERYLARYPQYAEDFIDLLHELRIQPLLSNNTVEDEAIVQHAWSSFAAIPPGQGHRASVPNPFLSFTGPAFSALAMKLRIRRSILIALRDRLVTASSIPTPFFDRLVRAIGAPAEQLRAYFDLPAVVAMGASYKSDEKPEAPTKISFEQLLDNSGVSADEKEDICTSYN